jgi:hypothetical protein
MRRLILSILFATFLASPVVAQDRAARDVISDQIAAFLDEDPEGAFAFASPFIQDKFGTPERFGQMVREGYPMVWSPSEVTFLDMREIGGKLWQEVLLRDAAGKGWIAEYELVEVDGALRINGVRIRKAPEQAV